MHLRTPIASHLLVAQRPTLTSDVGLALACGQRPSGSRMGEGCAEHEEEHHRGFLEPVGSRTADTPQKGRAVPDAAGPPGGPEPAGQQRPPRPNRRPGPLLFGFPSPPLARRHHRRPCPRPSRSTGSATARTSWCWPGFATTTSRPTRDRLVTSSGRNGPGCNGGASPPQATAAMCEWRCGSSIPSRSARRQGGRRAPPERQAGPDTRLVAAKELGVSPNGAAVFEVALVVADLVELVGRP